MNWEGFQQAPLWFSAYFSPSGSVQEGYVSVEVVKYSYCVSWIPEIPQTLEVKRIRRGLN